MSITGDARRASRRRSGWRSSTSSPGCSRRSGSSPRSTTGSAGGEGQLVEVDLLSSLLAALVNQASAYTAGGVVPQRMGNQHPSIAPYELLPLPATASSSSPSATTASSRRCARCSARPSWPRTRASPPTRRASPHRDALRRRARGTAARGAPAAEWASRLTAARVPAGVVNDIAGAFRLAESLGLSPIVAIPDGDGHEVRLARNPIRLSATPASYRLAPPSLGAPNRRIPT